ncbi:hypothetical protein NLG97_g9119 [Lecanicillium saksenae]|uniref:Uncharacterized protein n=1 Tax=Lecanicillium saksenae TaxID=468837 RepID=A0ACC1QID1_9HYPO|nr:hypothetical protein NLG97_g9119 [Lecanicillium saksenae]
MSILTTLLLILPLFFISAASAAVTTITVTAAPSIPSKEPSYSKRYLFTSAVLNSTNTYRRQHNASSLAWNATLASFAKTYLAGKQKDDCAFEHSGGPYGENIAIGYGNATAAVEAWGDERSEYDFGKAEFTHETGHFTQLVWKDTTTVGCERVLCGVKGWFVACEYWPRGNVVGKFGDEVQKQVSTGARGRQVNMMAAVMAVMVAWLL